MDRMMSTDVGKVGDFQRLRDGDPVWFASEACLIVRRPGMSCGVCREACPAAVMSGGQWSIAIESDGCLGCGMCAAVCPTGALAVEGFASPATDAAAGKIAVECRRVAAADREEGSAQVPCLGGLTASDLLEFVEGDDATVAIIDRGWCANCPVAQCADPWRGALDEAHGFLREVDDLLARRLVVESKPLPPDRARPTRLALRPDKQVDRRGFLRNVAHAAPSRDPLLESRRAVFGRGLVRPLKREQIVDRIESLAGRLQKTLPPSLMPAAKIAEGCDLTGVCAAICPTGALKTERADDTISLEFDSRACIACGECQRACPGGALSLWPGGDGTLPDRRRTLVTRPRNSCVGCGADFVTRTGDEESELCVPCRRSMQVMGAMSALRAGRAPAVHPDRRGPTGTAEQ